MAAQDLEEHHEATASKPGGTPWSAIGAIASLLAVVALVVALFVGFRTARELREAHDREAQARGAIRDEIRATQAFTLVDLRTTPHTCLANNSETSCTVTNPTSAPISTCFRGTITQKKARGVHLSSMVGCTGRITPYESRTVSVPWSGGFAKDVCSSTNRFGTEMLDWEVCDFMQEPVENDALAKLAMGGVAPAK
jgi:hypothetical protein